MEPYTQENIKIQEVLKVTYMRCPRSLSILSSILVSRPYRGAKDWGSLGRESSPAAPSFSSDMVSVLFPSTDVEENLCTGHAAQNSAKFKLPQHPLETLF